MKLEESYERLVGRRPTESERRQLHRVRDALDLRDNDALFMVIMALQHYQTLYESIPNRIAEASEEAVRRPNRLTWRALSVVAAAILYVGAYAIKSRDLGYAAGYEAGHNARASTESIEGVASRTGPTDSLYAEDTILVPSVARQHAVTEHETERAGE